jgi:hypothetical protein|nr:MAG TPA: BAH domain protein [Caudoviricetes sp.]
MQIKKGDFVLISGIATGYGTLEGYIDKVYIDLSGESMVEVTYTQESKDKANGDLGIVCRACFCKPLIH